ncbi:MAG: AAA family ATPase [Planctomycetaceae bacterium]
MSLREQGRLVMRIIAIMNQKGGVGKTTTSVNLSAGLARAGKKVCLIDLDPQAHSSIHLGVDATGSSRTIYQVFAGARTFREVLQPLSGELFLAPSDIDLAATELELVDSPNREFILRDALKDWDSAGFDYVVMDCPPSLGVLTVNALTAATDVFIPLQPHFFALQGLSKLFETTALVTRRLNRGLKVGGIVLCLYETGTRLAADVSDDLHRFLTESDPQAPWAKARVFDTRIRRNIKLAEAPSFGQSIFEYASTSAGALDYAALAEEVIRQQQGTLATEGSRPETVTFPPQASQSPQSFAA